MRVLGIDPGLTRCGVGRRRGSLGRPLTWSTWASSARRGRADRAAPVRRSRPALEQWLDAHRPDAVAVERVFSQHNVQTVMGTAQASGIALLVAARRGLPVACTPRARSRPPSPGAGGPTRHRSARWSTRLLRLAETPQPADAADALALAICHIWRGARRAAGSRPPLGRAQADAEGGAVDDRVRQRPGGRRRPRPRAVLEVGGVGLELQCTPDTSPGCASAPQATLPTAWSSARTR